MIPHGESISLHRSMFFAGLAGLKVKPRYAKFDSLLRYVTNIAIHHDYRTHALHMAKMMRCIG